MSGWNELYQYYYPRLLNIAFRYCRNSEEAKDLVQDSFVASFFKFNQLRDPALFGAWVKKILVHKCIRKQRKLYDYYEGTAEIEWEQQLEDAEKQTRLHAVIANLPEVLRTTLLLRYFSSKQSYNEIAEILSVPVGTVRSRLNEAKAKLAAAWRQPVKTDSVRERNTWNQFYQETLSGLHHNAEQRRIFLEHLQWETEVMTPFNKLIGNGRDFFEGMIASDQACGSWLKPTDIISSGDISIIEQAHFNSPEHPDHCPPVCVVIIYRKKEKVERMRIYSNFSPDRGS
jgi:RNA polymerase sigma factor (sigma-70 family)